jgi:hypothetical protein
VLRVNPVGFFGMVFVLEGTSAALASVAAERLESVLKLPPQAFTYLRSHGDLDQAHVCDLAAILERLDHASDREAVLRCARGVYWLYGQMFRSLDDVERLEGTGARRSA